jgi:hypothetical protein
MQIKGTAIRSLLLAIERVCGHEAVGRVKEALPPEVRAQIGETVLATRFYPVEVVAALHDSIRQVLGQGTWEMNHRLGTEAAKIDFGAVYQVFIRVMDYDFVLDRIARAWGQYNSRGRLRITERSAGHAVFMIDDVSGYTEGMWEGIAGRCEGILQLCGSRRVRARLVTSNPTGCRIEADWVP